MLAKVALRPAGSNRFDGVSDALGPASHTFGDDREVLGKSAVIVNEQDILECLCSVASDELCDDFGSDRRPDMVYTVWAAHLFRVVKRCLTVTVGNDKDVRWREDLQGSLEGVGDESGRLVARDHEASVGDVRFDLGLRREIGWWGVVLEEDKKRSEGVAVAALVRSQIDSRVPTYNSAMPSVIPKPPAMTNLVATTQYNHQTAPFQSGIPISTK